MPTVKEIELSRPRYSDWRHPGQCSYKELLFVLNSQRDNVQDELGELEGKLEELQFDAADLALSLASLMDAPGLPERMQLRLKTLRELMPVSWDFSRSHFDSSLDSAVDKNVMARMPAFPSGARCTLSRKSRATGLSRAARLRAGQPGRHSLRTSTSGSAAVWMGY